MSKLNNIINEIDNFFLEKEKFENKKYYKILKNYQELEKDFVNNKDENINNIFQELEKKIEQLKKQKEDYDKYKKQQLELNFIKKEKICGVVESLIDIEDRALLHRLIEEAKKKWYKVEEISPEDANKVNQRFFSALKKCEEKCKEYISITQGDAEENYKKKIGLIDRFEKLLQGEDITSLSKEFKIILEEWKAIKYLPKEKENINDKFKDLLTRYHNKKDYFFKKKKIDIEEIINKKQGFINQLEELKNKININKLPWQKTEEILLTIHKKSLELPRVDFRFDKKKVSKKYYQALESILQIYKLGREDIVSLQKESLQRLQKILNEKKDDDLSKKTYEIIKLQQQLKRKDSLKIFSATEENKKFRTLANDFFDKNKQNIDSKKEETQSLFRKKIEIQEQLDDILKKDYDYKQVSVVKELSKNFFEIKLPRSKKNNLIYNQFKNSLDSFYLKKNKKEADFFLQNKKSIEEKKALIFRLKKLLNTVEDDTNISAAQKLQIIFKMNQSKQNDNNNYLEIQEIKKKWYEIKNSRNHQEKQLFFEFKDLLNQYYSKKKSKK